jgi:hypothetical protein
MHLNYDPKLVEESVFHAARENARVEEQLHAVTDPLYAIDDHRERQRRFSIAYEKYFRRLCLNVRLEGLLEEWPRIHERVGRCLVHNAARARAEGAELRVSSDQLAVPQYTLVIQVGARTLLNMAGTEPRLRRDLCHVDDMLNDVFAYDRQSLEGHAPRLNLIRDRYSVLWSTYVEGRLWRRGMGMECIRDGLHRQFQRAFMNSATTAIVASFDRVFQCEALTHEQILHWATCPDTLLQSDGNEAPPCEMAETCPVCGFPAFDWAPPETRTNLSEAIVEHHPEWSPTQRLCRQCAEIYMVAS